MEKYDSLCRQREAIQPHVAYPCGLFWEWTLGRDEFTRYRVYEAINRAGGKN